jgi:electron transport complex protein RnfG
MLNKDNIKFYLKTAAVLTIIASITALMMAVVNGLTAGRIADNLRADTETAMADLFPDAGSFEKLDISLTLPVTDVWRVAGNGNQTSGYCIFATVKGFKEEIDIIVGADTAGKCVGVKILSFAETRGLGSRISEAGYLEQYIGKVSGMTINHDVDAVAGATISSRALLEGVNAALSADKFGAADTAQTADSTEAVTKETAAITEETTAAEGGVSDEQVTNQP